MKKVLFVATLTSHINAFHIPYIKLLKENGYEVHVASNENEKVKLCDKFYNIPFERFPFAKNNKKSYKELKEIIDKNHYEIIHCHNPASSVVTRIAARKSRENGTRVIYTAHGFYFHKGSSLLNWIVFYPIEKICSKWTDTLITINQEDYKLAKTRFKKCKDIQLVNGVGLDTLKFSRKMNSDEKIIKRKEFKLKENDIVFSYVASISKRKNQKLLLKVIKKLREEKLEVKLLLAGRYTNIEKFKKWITKNKLEDRVLFLGDRTDINEILSITDIYLASSLREGLAVNIMEAMYKEVPIIATDIRGHRELIQNNESGFIVNNDVNEFKNRIKELLENQELKNKFVNNAKEKVKPFLLENVFLEMKRIYEKD